MENLEQLEKFIRERHFSDELFADVFKFIMNNYPEDSERRKSIRTMVEIWQRKYPNEMDKFNRGMKRRKELSKDKFSSDKDNDIRVLMSIPDSLLSRISMVVNDPKFLSEEANEKLNELEWFYKEFPQFRLPEQY